MIIKRINIKKLMINNLLDFLMDAIRFFYRMIWSLFHLRLYVNPEIHVSKDEFYCYDFTGRTKMANKIFSENGKLITVEPFPMPETKYCPFHNRLWRDLCMLDGGDCMFDSCKTCKY